MTERAVNLSMLTDLRSITRESDTCLTIVSFQRYARGGMEAEYGDGYWLLFGQAQLRRSESDDVVELGARMGMGATDFEHDSSWVVKLPLIGFAYDSLHYHILEAHGWVQPCTPLSARDQDLRVPLPGQDYYKDAFETDCKLAQCRQGEDGKFKSVSHPITKYIPEYNISLHRRVSGRRVSIQVGPKSAFNMEYIEEMVARTAAERASTQVEKTHGQDQDQ